MDKKFKILKIDHIAVAVKNLKESSTLFQLLGMDCEDIESVKSEKVEECIGIPLKWTSTSKGFVKIRFPCNFYVILKKSFTFKKVKG